MPSYKVHFVFQCSPETHWGQETTDEVIIEGVEMYVDGEECVSSDNEDSNIMNWEDAVDDITAKWENDSLSEYDYIDPSKTNPLDNGKLEFEDGTGNVHFETVKVEIFNDNKWEILSEIVEL